MYGSGSDGSGSKRFHGLHGSDGSGSHGSGSIRILVPPVPVRDGSYSFDGSKFRPFWGVLHMGQNADHFGGFFT